MIPIRHADFTHLAGAYANRVGYSLSVVRNLLTSLGITSDSIIADVGAGTGNYSADLLKFSFVKRIIAVEPNDAMRNEGERLMIDPRVVWKKGSGENTGLQASSVDWVVMASSFHWVDAPKALTEFRRILKDQGYFTAIWNPRNILEGSIHQDIEKKIYAIAPHIRRVSSGSSSSTATLFDSLISSGEFKDVWYTEVHHTERMTRERYLGIWQSVNDIRAQAGPYAWDEILAAIKDLLSEHEHIDVPYRTRAWTVQRV